MLLLDKAAGITSNRALQQVRHLYGAARAGHTGSLDPIATGLLPVCLGAATRVTTWLLDSTKGYRAHLRLGVVTDSGDLSGAVTARHEQRPSRAALEAALAGFRGSIEQVPPMYSALKHEGQRLYTLARRGIEVPRKARTVTVRRLELAAFEGDEVVLDIECSGGFYVRSLADDLGRALGCGAAVAALRRTRVGLLSLEQAVTLEHLQALPPAARERLLLPADAALAHLPGIRLAAPEAALLCHGRIVTLDTATQDTAAHNEGAANIVRLYSDAAGFIGIGTLQHGNRVAPRRLFPTGAAAAPAPSGTK